VPRGAAAGVNQSSSPTDRFNQYLRKWNVILERSLDTETSLIGFGTRATEAVVLKVVKSEGEEWRSGELLSSWSGHGAVPVLECENGAMLLERLSPGHSLAEMSMHGRDAEATEIIAGIIGRLSAARSRFTPAIKVEEGQRRWRIDSLCCSNISSSTFAA
jgi:streptomycin 6-kinase